MNIVSVHVECTELGSLLMHIGNRQCDHDLEQQTLQPHTILKLLYPNNMASYAIAVDIVNTYFLCWNVFDGTVDH